MYCSPFLFWPFFELPKSIKMTRIATRNTKIRWFKICIALCSLFHEKTLLGNLIKRGFFVHLKGHDGNFTEWTEWSNCSKDCDGVQNRYRFCTHPPPEGLGKNCTGDANETRPCGEQCKGNNIIQNKWSSSSHSPFQNIWNLLLKEIEWCNEKFNGMTGAPSPFCDNDAFA